MTVTNASSLLAEASAYQWSQLVFAKKWNDLRTSLSISDADLLEAFWSVAMSKPTPCPDNDLAFLDLFDLEVDKDLVVSLVSFLIATGQLSPEVVWHFIVDQGGLTKRELGKIHIELMGDMLKSLVISLLSLNENIPASIDKNTAVVPSAVYKFKLLLEMKVTLLTSICDFLSSHWDFNNQLTCLRLSKCHETLMVFEKSMPLKAFCQLSTPRASEIVENWRRLQNLALSMAALDRSAIAIKESLISMSHRWITRSQLPPFTLQASPSKPRGNSNGASLSNSTNSSSKNELAFCSLFCGAVDYLYALDFGSNLNRYTSSEFLIPLLRSLALSTTLFVTPSNSESAIAQQLSARYAPLVSHLGSALGVSMNTLFQLIEHAAKTAVQQHQVSSSTLKKFSINNFVDTRPNYILRVFLSCRLSCLAKSLDMPKFQGNFVAELITNAGRDMTRQEFEDYVGRDLLKNLHISPFLSRTEMTRLQLVLGERASKEDSHLALGVLSVVDLFKCYLLTGTGVTDGKAGLMVSEGAVGSFLENIINKRIKNFAALILTSSEDDDDDDHHQDDNEGHLPDLDTFMSTLPDSLAESVGIGLETASRLLFLLGKTEPSRFTITIRRLVLANPTLAFILWLLVDEKLRRRQAVASKKRPPAKRRKTGNSDLTNSTESLVAISDAIKTNINTLKSPFNGIYSLLLTLSTQVRSLALASRNNSSSKNHYLDELVTAALKQPGVVNHYCVMREATLSDGAFKSGDVTATNLGAMFHRVLMSASGSSSNVIGVDTSESYHNFLAFALPLVAGLDNDTLKLLFKRWFSTNPLEGFLVSTLLCGSLPGTQLSFIVAAQVWNFSFFLILITMSSSTFSSGDIKQILTPFFTSWHQGTFASCGDKNKVPMIDKFRFVAVEMFFAELMFFANVNVCRLVSSTLPNDFILSFVTSSTPASYTQSSSPGSNCNNNSPVNRLLHLKRRTLGRLFSLDQENRFDEDFCIRTVCNVSPFEHFPT